MEEARGFSCYDSHYLEGEGENAVQRKLSHQSPGDRSENWTHSNCRRPERKENIDQQTLCKTKDYTFQSEGGAELCPFLTKPLQTTKGTYAMDGGYLTTGFFKGFFSTIKNQHVKETKCIGMGDPYCEWEFM